MLQSVPTHELLGLEREIRQLTKRDVFTLWAQWYFGGFEERDIQLGSSITGKEYIDRCFQDGDPEDWRFLYAQHLDQIRSVIGLVRTDLALVTSHRATSLMEADYLSSSALALASNRLDLLDIRAEVNERLENETRFLTRPDLDSSTLPEFRNPNYWMASARRQSSVAHWSEALDRSTYALTLARDANQAKGLASGSERDAKALPPILSMERNARFLRAQLLWRLGRADEAAMEQKASQFVPVRSDGAPLQTLDLAPFYNAHFNQNWHTANEPGLTTH